MNIEHPSTEELAGLEKPRIRRREVLAATGLERGRVQGWEQQGFWKWPGNAGEKRVYSIADTLRFALAAEMEASGISIRRTWEFLRETPGILVPGRVGFLLYVEVFRFGGDDEEIWDNCSDYRQASNRIAAIMRDALRDNDVRSVKSSTVGVGNIVLVTWKAIQRFGSALANASHEELLAHMAANDAEDSR